MGTRRRVVAVPLALAALLGVLSGTNLLRASADTNVVGNPGFEVDTSGWAAGTSSTSLARVAGGHSGGYSARLSNTTSGAQCALEDEPNWVPVTQTGPYTISLWARSDVAGRSLKIRVREYTAGGQAGSQSASLTMTTAWQQLSMQYTPAAPGQSRLEFQAYTSSSPVGVCFYADDVSISTAAGAANTPPTARDDTATTNQDTPVTVAVLANDTDPNGDPLTVTGATNPTNGTATVNANNTITYTPTTGHTGNDAFTYTINDGRGGTATATVNLTINPPPNPGEVFEFAGFGDVPYSSSAVTKYQNMIANINAGPIAFSVHVGDIGPGTSATCTTATVDRETARFDTFLRPLVYTPGDNEWVDCGSNKMAQLNYIRSTTYRGTGTLSRGQTPMALQTQAAAGYVENARWNQGSVTFATIHMTGSSDNKSDTAEQRPRRLADIAWVRETFAQAKSRGDRGVVLFAQIDPRFADPSSSTFGTMYEAVRQEVQNFNGQVLYIHGDGHDYISDRPVASLPNLRRVQVEGDGKVSYVKVKVDPALPDLFVIPTPTRF